MKKIVLKQFGQLEIQEVPIPVPAPGQAVIRIHYAGICGSDLHVYDGQHPTAKVPLVMGHEGAGTLVAINDSRTEVKVGDKVCAHTVKPCHACPACTSGRENLCSHVKIMGTNFDGVYTQYMLVDADRVIRFNDNVDDRLATLAEPLTVAVHDVRRSGLVAGDTVLISGAGPIGLAIAILARFYGASKIVMLEVDPSRIALAESFGFTVLNAREPACRDTCRILSHGQGYDRTFEVSAQPSSFATCIEETKPGGVMVQVGMPPAGASFDLNINKVIFGECDIRGVRHHTMNDMQKAVELINAGHMNDQLLKLASVVYPLEETEQALERARRDKSVLRVLLDLGTGE